MAVEVRRVQTKSSQHIPSTATTAFNYCETDDNIDYERDYDVYYEIDDDSSYEMAGNI